MYVVLSFLMFSFAFLFTHSIIVFWDCELVIDISLKVPSLSKFVCVGGG